MMGTALRIILATTLFAGLSACNRDNVAGKPLFNLRGSAVAPDEFLVVPQNPLETPTDLASLPEPTPGAGNLADIDFTQRLYTSLGGRPNGGRAGVDAAVVNAARANSGVTPGIRDVLRQEDQAFREAQAGRIARLAKKREAVAIYDDMLLDPYAELARLRALGVITPAAPPQ